MKGERRKEEEREAFISTIGNFLFEAPFSSRNVVSQAGKNGAPLLFFILVQHVPIWSLKRKEFVPIFFPRGHAKKKNALSIFHLEKEKKWGRQLPNALMKFVDPVVESARK